MKKILITLFVLSIGCAADSLPTEDMPASLSKDDARAQSLTEEGKADHRRRDICQLFGWYNDNECDEFCPSPDPDCEGECISNDDCFPIFCVQAPCPVNACNEDTNECELQLPLEPGQCRADSDCVQPACDFTRGNCPEFTCENGTCEDTSTPAPECRQDSDCAQPECDFTRGNCPEFTCENGTCEDTSGPVCGTVNCALFCEFGFRKNENGCDTCSCNPDPNVTLCGGLVCGPAFICENDSCVPDPDKFCERARCAAGTVCDEDTDSCVAQDFCPRAFCGPGTVCDEEANACVPDPDTFCQRARCASGTYCDEDTDSCLPNTCQSDDAQGRGFCSRFFGYKWDGESCTGVSGCSCSGDDCRDLYQSYTQCMGDHRDCKEDCRSTGCGDGSYCSLCWTSFQCIPNGAVC